MSHIFMHVIIIYNSVLTHTVFVLEKYDNIIRHLVGERKCAGDERSMVAIDWLELSNSICAKPSKSLTCTKISTNCFFAFLISAI